MSTKLRPFLLLLLLLFATAACSSPSENENQTPDENSTADADADADSDADADADSDADADGEVTCAFQTDCADTEFCHDGECLDAPTCAQRANWSACVDAFEDIDPDLARRAYCDEDICRVACLTDLECPGEKICSDNGKCIDFTGEITGHHPGGDEPAPLQAGVGNTLMHFPIGLSQGGYGSRAATNAGRYVESLRPTWGKMHGLYARSILVDDGQRQLLFMRAPIIFPSMALHEAIARKLQEETGRDWRDSLLISGTHTHSGPARFWHIPRPDYTALPMGSLGIDEFSQQAFDWLVQSMTESALEAMADLSPAKMGWEVVESFDTDDFIASDRWGEVPPFDDNRILLIRVDDLDDNPRAVLMSFGSHGIIHSSSYMNGDSIVGMERGLENALGEEYDTFAPVLYFNQNGGNISPRGDKIGHSGAQRYEELGHLVVDRTFDALKDMDTTSEWSFNGHTHRFPITFESFGYEGHEFGAPNSRTRNGEYLFGGLSCTLQGDSDYNTHVEPEDYSCLGIHQIHHHRPVSVFTKSQISAFQLNDLTIITMPGELTMPLGWQVQRDIRDAFGIDPFKSFTMGYSQDHLLYLTPTNLRGERPPFPGLSLPEEITSIDELPDYAFSFLQGGYESQMSPWGHKLGDFLVSRAIEAVGTMLGEPVEPEFHIPLPDEFTPYDEPTFPVDETDPARVGEIVAQPPATVERRQYVDIAWHGGDPGAEMPQAPLVTLQRKDGDAFIDVLNTNRAPYTNREYLMLTRMRRAPESGWEWAAYWEETKDFPLGTYRFKINGHYLSADTDERTSYESITDEFELVPSSAIEITEITRPANQQINLRLNYPAAPELDTDGVSGDRGRPTGSFRLHHRLVPTGMPIPVEELSVFDATITQNGTVLPLVSTPEVEIINENHGGRTFPVSRLTLEFGDANTTADPIDVEISVVDTHGNTGTIALTLTE